MSLPFALLVAFIARFLGKRWNVKPQGEHEKEVLGLPLRRGLEGLAPGN